MKKQILFPVMLAMLPAILASCTNKAPELSPMPPSGSPATQSETTAPSPENAPSEPTPIPPTSESPTPVPPEESTGMTESVQQQTAPAQSASFTKTKKVSYQFPGGMDDIEFTVSVENDIITAASSKTLAINEISKGLQDNFALEIGKKVIGKNIKNLQLDVVGGGKSHNHSV